VEDKNNKNKQPMKVGSIIQFIKELRKTPRGRSALFFGFYIIFFALVFLVFRSSGTSAPYNNDKTESFNFKFAGIVARNYQFDYTYQINDNTILFEGETNRNKELFTRTTDVITNYYRYNDRYFQLIGNEQVEVVNLFYYNEFLNIDLLKQMLNEATFISKTEYAEGFTKYNYQITTTTLVKIIDGNMIDIDDPVNTIEIVVNKNNEVTEIIYDISSYTLFKDNIMKTLINLKYSRFGEIEEINIDSE